MNASTKTSLAALSFTACMAFAVITRHASPFTYNLLLCVTGMAVLVNGLTITYMAWNGLAPYLYAPAWARWTQFYIMCALIGYLAGTEPMLAAAFLFIACSDLMLIKNAS